MKRLVITTLLILLATQCVPIVYADGPVCLDTPTPQPTLTPDPTATLVPTDTPMPTATELPTNTPWPTLPVLTPEPQKERLTDTPTPQPVLGTPIKFEPTDTPIPEATSTKRGKYNTPVPTATITWMTLPNTGNDEPITMGDVVWWLSVLVGLMFIGFVIFASVVVATRSK